MKTILIIDPECSGESLAGILSRHGYSALMVPRAGKALELLRGGASVDLVIMEMLLPDMSGLELLAAIRKLRPGLPVVVVTSGSSIESYLHAINMGVAEYLNKPVMSQELSYIVSSVLDRSGSGLIASSAPEREP
jgi:DNA-binding NtrC family response regulator